MSKKKSFWDWLFGTSCCGGRDKDKAYTGEEREEDKDRSGDKDKTLTTRQELEQEFDDQPGSVFREIDLHEDSVYRTGISGEYEQGQDYNDGSVEIR